MQVTQAAKIINVPESDGREVRKERTRACGCAIMIQHETRQQTALSLWSQLPGERGHSGNWVLCLCWLIIEGLSNELYFWLLLKKTFKSVLVQVDSVIFHLHRNNHCLIFVFYGMNYLRQVFAQALRRISFKFAFSEGSFFHRTSECSFSRPPFYIGTCGLNHMVALKIIALL